MNVFLSYASNDRNIAEQVAHSIRSRGHKVFFDRIDLPPGESYEKQIEQAIRKAAMMVFLVSPDSVAAGRFTQTELSFAQKRWSSASNHVLPVMICTTPINDIPNYLRSVTILEPVGNVPAEVAANVDRIAQRRMPVLKILGVFSTIAVIISVIGFYYYYRSVDLSIDVSVPEAFEKGYFGEADLYKIDVKVTNRGKVGGSVVDELFEVDPPTALTVKSDGQNLDLPTLISPGLDFKSSVLVSPGQGNDVARWRYCLKLDDGDQVCTKFNDWVANHEFAKGDYFPINPDELGKAMSVLWDGEHYLVAATKPNRIIRLSETGEIVKQSLLDGIPTTLSIGPLGLYLGTSAPDQILRLDFKTLMVKAKIAIDFPESLKGSFGDPVSNRPASLAQDGSNLWLITRGGASGSGLAYLDKNLSKLETPPYYDDVSFDLKGMSLRSGSGGVWTGQNDTIPASITKLTKEFLTVFEGHDYEVVSCATDVLSLTEKLLVPDCDGRVIEVIITDKRLQKGGEIDSMIGYESAADAWSIVRLGLTPAGKVLGAVTVTHNSGSAENVTSSSSVNNLGWNEGEKVRFRAEGASIIDMAVGKKSALLILESESGERQLVAPKLYD